MSDARPSRAVPRVVIDGRMVGEVPHGFARYVASIAAGLRRVTEGAAPGGETSPLRYEPVFLTAPGAPRRAFEGFRTVEAGARFLSPLELIELPVLLRRLRADLYHSPTFSSARALPCPWIVTVHDLNHLKYGGWKEKLYYERLLRPFVKGAAAVATVSDFSRRELAAWSGASADRIDIVHNAIAPELLERADAAHVDEALLRRGLERRGYFFCLSNPKPHKNVKTLVEAYAAYRARPVPASAFGGTEGGSRPHWDLVLNLRPGELELPSDVPGLRLMGPPDDADARALIAGSGAVVFPSEYEGFGLPPVEAACLGAPLVVSRIAPHREALADLLQGEALWVEPKDTEAWAVALGRATAGGVLGASVESRSQLMRRFSVLKLGAHMDRIYRRVLDRKKEDPS